VIDNGNTTNGWSNPPPSIGAYGQDYNVRAGIALAGLGANPPADAVYKTALLDGAGQTLDSSAAYTLTFAAGQTPPTHAFWSVTLYDPAGYIVANSVNKSAVSSWQNLTLTDKNELTLYLQTSPPTDPTLLPNWLPTSPLASGAAKAFTLTFRAYWPAEALLNGSWTIPPLVKQAGAA
jgi:hypothetical protein